MKNLKHIPDITKEQYRKIKQISKSNETENYDKIVLIPCSGNQGWYEMGDHSALIYYYKICQPLDAKPNFSSDDDSFVSPYEIGRIRVCAPDKIKERLINTKLFKHVTINDNYIITFYLNTKYSKTEMEKLRKKEEERRLNERKIIKVSFMDPTLARTLIDASSKIHNFCTHHMDNFTATNNGAVLVKCVDEMLRNYYLMCESGHNKFTTETWDKMINLSRRAIIELQIIGNLNIISIKTLISTGEKLKLINEKFKKHKEAQQK